MNLSINLSINFSSKKSIFLLLVSGKILLLPFLFFAFNYFDLRPNALFLLGDLPRYEDSVNILNLFNFGTWVSNVGFMIIAFFIKSISDVESIKLLIYSFISLLTISYSQTIILDIVFKAKRYSNNNLKIFSMLLSIINFYILIYSFKPNSDVFGCLGIAILIHALLRKDNYEKQYNTFLKWTYSFLILCMFRNNLIFLIPFLFFTKIFSHLKQEIYSLGKISKTIVLVSLIFLLTINFYQILGSFSVFINSQNTWGAKNIWDNNTTFFSLTALESAIRFILEKLVFLLSAREAIGMSGNWIINSTQGSIFTTNVFITNILSAIILFTINIIGLFSIFKVFSKRFKNVFLFSLIPLIPFLSFATHHRYFLPYSLVTSATLPFLFEKKGDLNKARY